MINGFKLKVFTNNILERNPLNDVYLPISYKDTTTTIEVFTIGNKSFNAVIINGTNLTNLRFSSFQEVLVDKNYPAGDKNIVETFAQTTPANAVLQISAPALPFYSSSLKIVSQIMDLGNTLTTFNKTDNSKKGNYYLNSGELVLWEEYKKSGGKLNIKNISPADKNNLLQAFHTHKFLTFLFEYAPGNAEAYEFGLTDVSSEHYDKRTGLFELDLLLAER